MESGRQQPRLLLVSEKDQRLITLSGSALVVGRAPECGLALDDTLISRQHAVFEKHDQRVWVRDLGSHNGTYLNGERITNEALNTWDLVRLGRSVAVFLDPQCLAPQMPDAAQTSTSLLELGSASDNNLLNALARSRVPTELAQEWIEGLRRELRLTVIDQILGNLRRQSVPATWPELEGFELASHRNAAVEGGGDFLALARRPGTLSLCLGTVRGWGMNAALNGALAHSAIKSVLELASAPPEVLMGHAQRCLDSIVQEGGRSSMLMARFGDALDVTIYGRTTALIARSNGAIDVLRNGAAHGSSQTESFELAFAPGDHFLALSEGVLRSDDDGERFSFDELCEVVQRYCSFRTERLLDVLRQAYQTKSRPDRAYDASFLVLARH